MRVLWTATFAICLPVSISTIQAQDDSKPKTRADKLLEMQMAMAKEQQSAFTEYNSAEGEKNRTAAEDKILGIAPAYAQKLYKLAEEDPKDETGYEAAMLAVRLGRGNPAAKKAMDLILTYHLDSASLAAVVPSLGSFEEPGMTALKTLSEKARKVDTRGLALYYFGSALLESADNPRSGKPLPLDEQRMKFKDAEAVLTKAAREYGSVETLNATVGKEVEGQLFFLNNLTIGKTLPDAESEDLDGKKVKISDYRGKVVVLDIWATWCGPCKAMIPHERKMTGKLKDKPFTLISLSADDKKETLTKFLDETAMPWTHWWNGGAKGGVVEAYRVRFYPTVFILDAKGVIRHKHLRGTDMEKAVEKLLAEVSVKGE